MNNIIDFLLKNGYKEATVTGDDYRNFIKDGVSCIDIGNDEIVFVGELGDWLHIPINYYALIGALVHHRQIAIDYKS